MYINCGRLANMIYKEYVHMLNNGYFSDKADQCQFFHLKRYLMFLLSVM